MDEKAAQSHSGRRYKSPKRILFRFFEKSRNKWRDKCIEAKYQIKLLQKKIRYLEKNKKIFKTRVKVLEAELQQMKNNEKQMADKIERLKKNLYH